jgi:hypothetical protein
VGSTDHWRRQAGPINHRPFLRPRPVGRIPDERIQVRDISVRGRMTPTCPAPKRRVRTARPKVRIRVRAILTHERPKASLLPYHRHSPEGFNRRIAPRRTIREIGASQAPSRRIASETGSPEGGPAPLGPRPRQRPLRPKAGRKSKPDIRPSRSGDCEGRVTHLAMRPLRCVRGRAAAPKAPEGIYGRYPNGHVADTTVSSPEQAAPPEGARFPRPISGLRM